MKKFFIFIGVIIVIALIFIGYVYITTKPTIYSQLSPRAKEYLKLRRNANDRGWQSADIDNPKSDENRPSIKTITADKCFQITIPIPVSEVRQENDCQYRVFLAQPSGTAVLYRKHVEVSNVDDLGDIIMRRLYTDQYKEQKVIVDGRTFFVFKKIGDIYEKSAFYLDNKELYVFNLIVPTNENLDMKFTEMLLSAKIYNEQY